MRQAGPGAWIARHADRRRVHHDVGGGGAPRSSHVDRRPRERPPRAAASAPAATSTRAAGAGPRYGPGGTAPAEHERHLTRHVDVVVGQRPEEPVAVGRVAGAAAIGAA